MNNKKKNIKITRKNPPFYYAEGYGWMFDAKVKTCKGFVHIGGQWFASKADAKEAFDKRSRETIEKAEKNADEDSPTKQRWEDFVEDFLELRRSQVRASSICSCDLPLINKFFDPLFSGKRCEEVFTVANAMKFRKQVQAVKLSRKRKNRAITMFSSMLEFAFETFRISDLNAYRGCKANMHPFKAISEEEALANTMERPVLDKAQVERLVAYCKGTKDWMFVEMLADVAMRINELCAIRPMDIDFDKGMVTVRRQWTRDENSVYRLSAVLKSKRSYRTIPVSDETLADLKAWIYEKGIGEADLIFKGEDVDHMDIKAFNVRLHRYCKEAGVPVISSHGFRHAKATLLSQVSKCDADRQAASYILGHSISVDQEVYSAHVSFDQAKKLIAKA